MIRALFFSTQRVSSRAVVNGPSNTTGLSLANAFGELDGLEFVIAREVERNVVEGERHTGLAMVTQVLARKAG